MAIKATIMNTFTGRPIQTMTFEPMTKLWASFALESGRLVTAERIDVGKPVNSSLRLTSGFRANLTDDT